jgi:hypothetical protein
MRPSGYKHAVRRFALTVVALTVLVAPAGASSSPSWGFKTPGGAAYCGTDENGWICIRPRDGSWIRLTGYLGRNVDVRQGTSERFRGYRGPVGRTLGFGDVFYSSDAALITCRSRRRAVTCTHIEGLSFTLNRSSGYRIFWDAPGFPPNVLPLFRTRHDIRCGIDRDNLEPSVPILTCWRALDGLVLGIAHVDEGRRGGHGRWEKAIGFRPSGFSSLDPGHTFEWRCRQVTESLAERCSARAGEPVFTCTSTRARLTCTNRNGHGFWASLRGFYTF